MLCLMLCYLVVHGHVTDLHSVCKHRQRHEVLDSLGAVAIPSHAPVATPDLDLPHLAIGLIWC